MLEKNSEISYNDYNIFHMEKILNKDILSALACPVCGGGFSLSENAKSLICENRHCYDIAKSGYVNFCGSHGGDSKEAIAARREFLSLEYYRPIADAVVELLKKYSPTATVADLGCGEGYYSDIIAKSGFSTLGFDLSRHGVEAAAKRRNANAFYSVASVFSLPVKSESIGALTNIFAPCAEAEYSRVLRSGGVLIVVGAAKDHLFGLKSKIYDTPSKNTDRADLPTSLPLIDTVRLTYEIELKTNDEIKTLFSMTPYFYRTDAEGFARLNSLDRVKTEVDVLLHVYKKG